MNNRMIITQNNFNTSNKTLLQVCTSFGYNMYKQSAVDVSLYTRDVTELKSFLLSIQIFFTITILVLLFWIF